VTIFVAVCAVMLLVAVGFVARPLLRGAPSSGDAPSRGFALRSILPVALGLPLCAGLLYALWSNYDWNAGGAGAHAAGDAAGIEEMLNRLEQRLADHPDDVKGWIMLGRSYVALGRYPRAVEAYQNAYDLTGGEDFDAATGLAEALALVDEASLNGRAGQIFEQVLEKSPDQPKALWYGAVMALKADNLPLARERMQRLLAQNPPSQMRSILEQQIAEISTQLGEAPPSMVSGPRVAANDASNAAEEGAPPAATSGAVRVDVTLDPRLAQQLGGPKALFIMARAAGGGGGPPLAAVRHTTAELPLSVELSDANAMIAGRTISSAGQVEIVARVSTSGVANQHSGDLFGSATYDVASGDGHVAIVIDQVVP
jgi:cytochrome c-type biogenesis protein CcmH